MTTTMPTRAGTTAYFASWTGYSPPVQPRDPIGYGEAEASRTFSVFVFDEQGRALSFEKWRARAAAHDPSSLEGRALPAGKLFFAPDASDEGRPGRLVSLDETQGLAAYYRAHVHPDGSVAMLEHVRRERPIRHDYRYWENGQLREYRYDSASERGVEEFDRDGNRVSSSTKGTEG